MFTGSLFGQGFKVYALMAYAIANARPDEKDTVELNPPLLSAIFGEPIKEIEEAIEYLCSEDAGSRSPGHGGKRLLPTAQPFTYIVVNLSKYRNGIADAEKRKFWREEKAKYRGTQNESPSSKSGYVYFLQKVSGGNVKIGFSANPWARLSELQTACDEPFKLLGVIPGNKEDECQWQNQFDSTRVKNEWFAPTDKLLECINESCTTISRTTPTTSTTVRHADADADADADTNANKDIKTSICVPSLQGNKDSGRTGYPVTVDDAIKQCSFDAVPKEFILHCYDKAESRAGCDSQGIPIANFPAYVRTQWKYERERLVKKPKGKGPNL